MGNLCEKHVTQLGIEPRTFGLPCIAGCGGIHIPCPSFSGLADVIYDKIIPPNQKKIGGEYHCIVYTDKKKNVLVLVIGRGDFDAYNKISI